MLWASEYKDFALSLVNYGVDKWLDGLDHFRDTEFEDDVDFFQSKRSATAAVAHRSGEKEGGGRVNGNIRRPSCAGKD